MKITQSQKSFIKPVNFSGIRNQLVPENKPLNYQIHSDIINFSSKKPSESNGFSGIFKNTVAGLLMLTNTAQSITPIVEEFKTDQFIEPNPVSINFDSSEKTLYFQKQLPGILNLRPDGGYNYKYAPNKIIALYRGASDKIIWINSDNKEAIMSVLENINQIRNLPEFNKADRIQYSGKYIHEGFFRDIGAKTNSGRNIYEMLIDNKLVYQPEKIPHDKRTGIYSDHKMWQQAHQFKYGPAKENSFYIIEPPKEIDNDKLIIYIHGGAFMDGTAVNEYDTRLFERFLNKGFKVATVEYRLMKDVPFYITIEDIAKGITAIYKLAEKKPEDIILCGLSAGATASELLLYSDKYPSIPEIGKFIGLAGGLGPDSVSDNTNTYVKNNSKEHRTYSSLLKYGNQPKSKTPALLLAGTKDEGDKAAGTNFSRNAQVKKLLEAGHVDVQSYYLEGKYNNHVGPQDAIIDEDPYVMNLLDVFLSISKK